MHKRGFCTLVAVICLLTLSSPAFASPDSVARAFYVSYQKSANRLEAFTRSQRSRLEPHLYRLLVRALPRQPSDGFYLDFDPFINGQMNAATVHPGKAIRSRDGALVPIYVSFHLPGHPQLALHLKLQRVHGVWLITNFLYPASHGLARWDLRSYLEYGMAHPHQRQ